MVGLYTPKFEFVKTRIQSAAIKPETETAARVNNHRINNFENQHICGKLLQAHDEKKLSLNRKAYAT